MNRKQKRKFQKELIKRQKKVGGLWMNVDGYQLEGVQKNITEYKDENNFEQTPTLNDNEIKEMGISNGYDDLELYHITSSENLSEIESSGGLKGNIKPNPNHGLSQKGYLYSTTTNDKKNWDKIKLYQLVEPDYLNESFGVTKAKTKEYSVIKINGSSLKKRGIKIQEDLNQSSTNKSNEEKCFKAFVGTNIIPIDELEIVGTFDTDLEMSKERAVYHRKVTERDMRIELNETLRMSA